jgi:hypothetical protein
MIAMHVVDAFNTIYPKSQKSSRVSTKHHRRELSKNSIAFARVGATTMRREYCVYIYKRPMSFIGVVTLPVLTPLIFSIYSFGAATN